MQGIHVQMHHKVSALLLSMSVQLHPEKVESVKEERGEDEHDAALHQVSNQDESFCQGDNQACLQKGIHDLQTL